ncbi:MAG: hypothetical protein ACI30L_08865 [Muribaculaceae bacterium]
MMVLLRKMLTGVAAVVIAAGLIVAAIGVQTHAHCAVIVVVMKLHNGANHKHECGG